MKKAILIFLKINPSDHVKYKIKIGELRKLAMSCDYKIIAEIIQTRLKPTSNYLIGRGKINELRDMVKESNIEKLIFYNILTSKQKYNIISATKCQDIIDRYDLILEIFDKMANDNLAKLQIEKARLIKNLPLIKLNASKKLKIEHPGSMGTGEYAYKSKIRGIQSKISKINSKIDKYKRLKESWLNKRKNLNMPIICLTGNYNAGKTTLFNLLTNSDKPVSDLPFTTLSSKYKKLSNKDYLFVDTIGFVLDIDPKLIKSFELNLFDMINADVILYLVDISDELEIFKTKFLNGLNILFDINVDYKKIIIVFNKIDSVNPNDVENKINQITNFFPYKFPEVKISAKNSTNIEFLFEKINEVISK
ncbi:MAG: GTPase HflX [Candidatus Helarchaeota archaeon]